LGGNQTFQYADTEGVRENMDVNFEDDLLVIMAETDFEEKIIRHFLSKRCFVVAKLDDPGHHLGLAIGVHEEEEYDVQKFQ
jgi:hypothetical protein